MDLAGVLNSNKKYVSGGLGFFALNSTLNRGFGMESILNSANTAKIGANLATHVCATTDESTSSRT